MLPESTFKSLFSTPPGVDLSLLCKAHRVPHLTAATPTELTTSLAAAWAMRRHCVVEVLTDPTRNTADHATLSTAARTAAQRALQVMQVRSRLKSLLNFKEPAEIPVELSRLKSLLNCKEPLEIPIEL
jgi:LmbE family N-acetylglucosaminyl deacetylase